MGSRFSFLFLILFSLQSFAVSVKKGQGEVSKAVSEYTVKFFIGIEDDSKLSAKCTGTFIDARTILTAAHCLPAVESLPSPFYLFTFEGSEQSNFFDIPSGQVKFYRYPAYETALTFNPDATPLYDLGLIRFAEDIHLGTVAKLYAGPEFEEYPTLASFDSTAKFYSLGVGNGKSWIFDPFKKLKQALLDMFGPLTGTEITVLAMDANMTFVPKNNAQMCQGDSGGPILVQDSKGTQQIGVNSAGMPTFNLLKTGVCGKFVYGTTLNKTKLEWINSTIISLEDLEILQADELN